MADTKLQAPGPWQTGFMQVGNGALLGYLPEMVELLGNKGDADLIRQGLELGDKANPRASMAGFVGGLALPGGVGAKGVKLGARFAKPAITAALGLAANAGTKAVAKRLGLSALSLLGASSAGGLGYGLFGKSSPKAPAEAETAAAAAPPQKQPDWYDQMAGVAGVDRSIIEGLVQRDGGVTLETLQTLGGMRPRAPTYRDIALNDLRVGLAQDLQSAYDSGDPQAIDDARKRAMNYNAQILGVEDFGSLATDGLNK